MGRVEEARVAMDEALKLNATSAAWFLFAAAGVVMLVGLPLILFRGGDEPAALGWLNCALECSSRAGLASVGTRTIHRLFETPGTTYPKRQNRIGHYHEIALSES